MAWSRELSNVVVMIIESAPARQSADAQLVAGPAAADAGRRAAAPEQW
jgi:hypothetical protein